MRHHFVLRVLSKLLLPTILLFALYVQFHGDYGPGGGFQAGVIFAAGFILYGLVFGLANLRTVLPPFLTRILMCFGVLVYICVGITSMALGGRFLDYNVLSMDPLHGQHVGILLIELGVGVTVAAVMVSLFYSFSSKWEDDS